MNLKLGTWLMLITFSFVTACTRGDSPVSPRQDLPPISSVQSATSNQYMQQLRATSVEGTFAAIAAQVPSFGGFYYNNEGQLVINVTDIHSASAARTALLATSLAQNHHSRRQLPLSSSPIVIQQVEFSFQELKEWRDRATFQLVRMDGVTSLDLDEARNRLTIGVSSLGVTATLRAILSDFGVPSEAVAFETRQPFQTSETLSDSVRPLRGGIVIHPSGCTYGFNAILNGTAYTVVNSHCTDEPFELDGESFNQHGEYIGDENWDRTPYECPSGTEGDPDDCRASDSALVEQVSGPDFGFGEIARTQCCGAAGFNNSGSKVIDSSQPYFEISGKGTPVLGEWLEKIGITTGWTYGQVSATCQDHTQTGQPSNFALFCQTETDYGSGNGDSGSPVFRWNIDDSATLIGIQWGINVSEELSVFSPIENIEFDINWPWWSYELEVN